MPRKKTRRKRESPSRRESSTRQKLPTYEFRFTREQWMELPLGTKLANVSLQHAVERAASRFLELKWSLSLSPAEPRTRAQLKHAQRLAAAFEKTLNKLDSKSLKLLGVKLFRHVANLTEFHRVLKSQVSLFSKAASDALGKKHGETAEDLPEVQLASEVARTLNGFGIKPNLRPDGPWARIVGAILEITRSGPCDVAKVIRKAKHR